MNRLNTAISTAECKYCSKLIQEPTHFIDLQGESFPVCCPGCEKAALVVHGLDLDNFYEHRDRCNPPPASCQSSRKTDSRGVSGFISDVSKAGPGRFALSVIIPDIRCAACTWLIEKALMQQPGMLRVRTNLSEKRVYLEFSNEDSIADLIGLIESLGYAVRPDVKDEMEIMLRQERKSLLSRLGVAGIGMMQVMMYALATYIAGPHGMDVAYETLFRWASLALAIPVTFYSASIFHGGAYRDLRRGSLGMDVPVSLAILAAFFLSLLNTMSHGEEVYFDTVCMFTFFLLLGRYIELGSRSQFQRSRDLTAHLVPDLARTGIEPEVFQPTRDLDAGSRFYVRPGEAIPADGVVISGCTSVDESAFTGEVMPVLKKSGSRVLAGSTNLDGELLVETTVLFADFVVNRISNLYRQATLYKPPFSILADKIARRFVVAVLLLAAGSGLFWFLQGSAAWMLVPLTVLVVSCPCALSLATPVAYTIAATTLRKQGIVVSNGAFLERLAAVNSVAFDKTGTLTEGDLQIAETRILTGKTESEVLLIAASLEKTSKHPIASAFGAGDLRVERCEIVPGKGVSGIIDGIEYRIGEAMYALGREIANPDAMGMWVLLASDQPLAWFRVEDKLREEARETIEGLRVLGFKASLLTGDRSAQGIILGKELGINDVRTGLSPEDKVKVLVEKQQRGERVLMVGDGINDTGAMGVADVSVAVSPVDVFVQSSADATLLSNNLLSLIVAVKYARRVRRIISQNVSWAVIYNLCVIPLAVTGFIEPWMAALGMSLSSVLVILNSNRLIRV